MKVKVFLEEINLLSIKYGLEILSLDYTDITAMCRIGYSSDIFIQAYLNSKKGKFNLALIVQKSRIYGVDKEGGFYHKHPVYNPESHFPLESEKEVSLEEFILESTEILQKLDIL